MSGLYYRRWTRMHWKPALKYFHQYGVLPLGYQKYVHYLNIQNPQGQNMQFLYRQQRIKNKGKDMDTKLIDKLFKKYPDLKYQSISRQKYHGNEANSYSYAYSFISEQKKLINSGYTIDKAFEITQQKFQTKMQRKMDQTLLSRNLAIGNKARSFLTIYQQQVQYESKLKMLRTERQVFKYEKKLQQMKKEVEEDIIEQDQSYFKDFNYVMQEKKQEKQNYERIFQKITKNVQEQNNVQNKYQVVKKLESDFENMFSQFYERAASKDRLKGLTDEEIISQISTSPKKIKDRSRQLIKYLKQKGNVHLNQRGQINLDQNLDQKLKKFILSSPMIKIALINEEIGYENPHIQTNRISITQALKRKKQLQLLKPQQLTNEQKKQIKQIKLKKLEQIMQKQLPNNKRIYKLYQLNQQRLLRLQIKYIQNILKQGKQLTQQTQIKLSKLINDFRRLKFRMQKLYKTQAIQNIAFSEHFPVRKDLEFQQKVQYEDLLDYLKKKSQDRRLKTVDRISDKQIQEMIKAKARPQFPHSDQQESLDDIQK